MVPGQRAFAFSAFPSMVGDIAFEIFIDLERNATPLIFHEFLIDRKSKIPTEGIVQSDLLVVKLKLCKRGLF